MQKWIFAMVTGWAIFSCQQTDQRVDTEKTAPNKAIVSDSVQNSNRPVAYKGILPCADCAGIETTLELFFDPSKINNAYQLTEIRLNNEQRHPKITRGEFVTLYFNDSLVIIYRLNPEDPSQARFFRKIDSNKIIMMTDEPPARNVSPENYILIRQ